MTRSNFAGGLRVAFKGSGLHFKSIFEHPKEQMMEISGECNRKLSSASKTSMMMGPKNAFEWVAPETDR